MDERPDALLERIAGALTRRFDGMLAAADVVVTMGCGDACPVYPGKRYQDWLLDEPEGAPIERVREIRDHIDERVRELLAELSHDRPVTRR